MLMATAATTAGAYVRHDPTQTTLHALVARHIETFLAFDASGQPPCASLNLRRRPSPLPTDLLGNKGFG